MAGCRPSSCARARERIDIQVRRRGNPLSATKDRQDELLGLPLRFEGAHVERIRRVDDDAGSG